MGGARSLAPAQVKSFGVGSNVKLPGPNPASPNTYAFGTPYAYMAQDLSAKDAEAYARSGLLAMLARNTGARAHAPPQLCVSFCVSVGVAAGRCPLPMLPSV